MTQGGCEVPCEGRKAEAARGAVGLILQAACSQDGAMQEMDGMRMKERASGRVSHSQQCGAMRQAQGVACKHTIAGRLGRMNMVFNTHTQHVCLKCNDTL